MTRLILNYQNPMFQAQHQWERDALPAGPPITDQILKTAQNKN
jgi:hypothetical protein